MRCDPCQLLDDLHRVDWETGIRIYGNHHSTLIGLLTQWWVQSSPDRHSAVEAGPTNGYRETGKRGQCDAMFCLDESPIGVLEVEGTRLIETARKIGYFFDARYPELSTLEFAILLVYAYEPTGIGTNRNFLPAVSVNLSEVVAEITRTHSTKSILLLGLNKQFERCHNGIRSKNEYYMGTPTEISGQCWQAGKIVASRQFVTNRQRTNR